MCCSLKMEVECNFVEMQLDLCFNVRVFVIEQTVAESYDFCFKSLISMNRTGLILVIQSKF